MFYQTSPVRGVNFRGEYIKDFVTNREMLKPEDLVELVREPDNAYDENAIMVMAQSVRDSANFDLHIGYVAREIAETVAPLMDGGMPLRASIFGFNTPITPVITIEQVDTETTD